MTRRHLPRMFCRIDPCMEMLPIDDWWSWRLGLCPSCRYVGKRALSWGMFVGGLIAGAIAWVLR